VRHLPLLALLAFAPLLCLLCDAPSAAAFAHSPQDLLPVPFHLELGNSALTLGRNLDISREGAGAKDPLVVAAAARLTSRIAARTGSRESLRGSTKIVIECAAGAGTVQQAIEDESYALVVTSDRARLTAASPYGVARGIETLAQLVVPAAAGWEIPAVTIEDTPRFPWRGLLLDVCRHFMPVGEVLRTLDGMAAAKLNVLHWHLSEDQGFRVESRVCPKLHELGSDGLFYTQDEVRRVVAYAREQGIRVVPEFDVPGHSTAWVVGYPELAAVPGVYAIERRWGVFDPCLDPTREETYRFLDRLFGEMAALFPDPYLHIGGDEVNGVQWDASPRVAAFKVEHGLADNAALQAYFNTRLLGILRDHGKTMIGWDEILQAELPREAVIQSWRGPGALAKAAAGGRSGILSAGWYLDHMLSAEVHYAVDPLGGEAALLPPRSAANVLGGEACMWAEFVTPEMLDGRVWPRAAAIAERLWSPAVVRDVPDMYRRLERFGDHLEAIGLRHRSGPRLMLERLAGGQPAEALVRFAALLEPVKNYQRSGSGVYTQLTPLDRLVDAVPPESDAARVFGRDVDALLADPGRASGCATIAIRLQAWRRLHDELTPVFAASAPLREAEPLVDDLAGLGELGLRALAALASEDTLQLGFGDGPLLARAPSPRAELLLMVAPHVARLVAGATGGKP